MTMDAHAANRGWLPLAIAIIAALFVAAWLYSQAKLSYLTNDSAQYVSTARNIVRGDGVTTSIRYYEQQHQHELPAPQTSWPPVFPVALAAMSSFGVEPKQAAWLVPLLAFVASALVCFRIARDCGASNTAAATAAVLWLASGEAWLSILRGLSETLFILLTLLSVWLLLRFADRRWPYPWIALAGLVAAAAFLTRYAGIAFLPAGVLAAALLPRSRVGLLAASLRAAAYATPVALIVVLTFARNLALSGSLTGGPRVDAAGTLSATLQHLEWSIRRLLVGPADLGWVEWLPILACVAGGVVLLLGAWRASRSNAGGDAFTRAVAWWLAVAGCYVGFTLSLLAYIGLTTRPEIVSERYVLPVLPFVILAAVVLADRLVARLPRPRAALGAAAVVATAFTGSQIVTGSVAVRDLPTVSEGWLVASALNADAGGGTVADLIRREVPPGGSVLEGGGQLIGLHLDLPTVGLPSFFYSRTVWDEAAVYDLVVRTDVAVLCVFRKLLGDAEIRRSRQFVQELNDGARPAWLALLHESEEILVFRVRRPEPPP